MRSHFAAAILVLSHFPACAQDWVTVGGNEGRTGFVDFELGEARFAPAWALDREGERSSEQATIAGDQIFVVPRRGLDFRHSVRSFSLSEGILMWEREYPSIYLASQPTYFEGNIYFLTTDRRDFSHLRALDATTGETRWEHRFRNHRGSPAPVIASDGGLWLNGGSSAGIYRFSLEGVEELFVPRSLDYEHTPTLVNGQLYTWVDETFEAHDPVTGEGQWSLPISNGAPGFGRLVDYPVVTDAEALMVDRDGTLVCVDLSNREVRWRSDQNPGGGTNVSFQGLPAVADNRVFAIARDRVVAFDLATGEVVKSYPTIELIDSRQPLLLRDHFIVGNRSRSFVINRETGLVVQDLLLGGPFAFANGYLVLSQNGGGIQVLEAKDDHSPGIVLPDVFEDRPYRTQLSAQHLNLSGEVTYRAIDPPPFLEVAPDGLVTGLMTAEPTTDEVTLTVVISNGEDPPVTETYPIRLVPQDDPPVISAFQVRLLVNGAPQEILIADVISDEDTPLEDLSFLFSRRGFPGSEFPFFVTVTDGKFIFEPKPNRWGQSTAMLTVTQPDGRRSAYIVPIAILESPATPGITFPIPSQSLNTESPMLTLDLNRYFIDPDPGTPLAFSIFTIKNEDLFERAVISGDTLELAYAPFAQGDASVFITAEDPTGRRASQVVRINGPDFPDLEINLDPSIRLNRRTGLLEQKITVTSPIGRPSGAVRINVEELEEDYQLLGAVDNSLILQTPLEPGIATEIVLEYHSSSTRTPPNPVVSLTSLPAAGQPTITPSTQGPAAVTQLADRSVLLEFPSEPGKSYSIQYSCDLDQWFSAAFPVTAVNNRTLWLDQGLPKTRSHPQTCPSRYYRVREVLITHGP